MTLFNTPPSDKFIEAHDGWSSWRIRLAWNLRNFAGGLSDVLRTDSMPGLGDWKSSGGWLFVIHKSGLPFLSFRPATRGSFPWVEGYIGWRPNGAPGIAIRRAFAKGY